MECVEIDTTGDAFSESIPAVPIGSGFSAKITPDFLVPEV